VQLTISDLIMKSYTDLEQSKKLAEILPLESADMYYKYVLPKSDKIHYIPEIGNPIDSLKWYNEGYTFRGKRESITLSEYCIPCWSLAALLDVLPIVYINNKKEICGPLHIDITDSETPFVLWYVNPLHKGSIVELKTKEYDNMIDACYEMIIKLDEQKLL